MALSSTYSLAFLRWDDVNPGKILIIESSSLNFLESEMLLLPVFNLFYNLLATDVRFSDYSDPIKAFVLNLPVVFFW